MLIQKFPLEAFQFQTAAYSSSLRQQEHRDGVGPAIVRDKVSIVTVDGLHGIVYGIHRQLPQKYGLWYGEKCKLSLER